MDCANLGPINGKVQQKGGIDLHGSDFSEKEFT
jgi:hypothetical protein